MPDKYEIRAHYIPALLCSAPFMALGTYFIAQIDSAFWSSVIAQTAGGVTTTFALYFLAAYTCRHVGKWLEDHMFHEGQNFPTTQFLVAGSTDLSPERQHDLRAKIRRDFDINLSDKTDDTPANRLRIHEAIGQIRQKFFKKNELILQRNIQFGFAKNIAGGSIVATLASVVLCVLSLIADQAQTLRISIFLLVAYTLLSLYGLIAMRSNAKRYAHTLFDEFLAS